MVESDKPRVSVIVLNWNGEEFLGECLDSLLAQSLSDIEIIVVDNGSSDRSASIVEQRPDPRIRWIPLGRNLGYAAGNNRGFREVKSDLVALLNNDAVADVHWLRELYSAAGEHNDDAMFATKVLSYENRDTIDNVGHLLYPDGLNRGRGRLETDTGRYRMEEVAFPSGCAALYRTSAVREVGGFDESFFSYGDDTDLGLKIRYRGRSALYVPNAVVYHHYSRSFGQYSPEKAFLVERNRFWIAVKFLPLDMLLLSPLHTTVRFILQATGALSGTGAAGQYTSQQSRLSLVVVLIRAIWAGLRGLPEMWRKRRAIRETAKVDAFQVRSWFRRFRISAKEIALKD